MNVHAARRVASKVEVLVNNGPKLVDGLCPSNVRLDDWCHDLDGV
jgi:hypothetical protein